MAGWVRLPSCHAIGGLLFAAAVGSRFVHRFWLVEWWFSLLANKIVCCTTLCRCHHFDSSLPFFGACRGSFCSTVFFFAAETRTGGTLVLNRDPRQKRPMWTQVLCSALREFDSNDTQPWGARGGAGGSERFAPSGDRAWSIL